MLQNLRQANAAHVERRPFRLRRRPEERVRMLGGTLDLVKAAEVFHFMRRKIKSGEPAIVANHNLHSLYLLREDAEIRAFFDRADLVEVDSTPLILWAQLNGQPSRRFHRCTYLDWRDAFWDEVQASGWRVYFLGGAPGVAETARARILDQWPAAELAVRDGYFDMSPGSAENAAIVAEINAFQPNVLLVGMGMPRQEAWVVRNLAGLPPCVTLTVGGAFDYEAGVQVPCPRWIGQLGLEWLFRLAMNPRRMFRRYCVEPWRLIGPALDDLRDTARRRLAERRAEQTRAIAAQAAFPRLRGDMGVRPPA